MSPSNDCVLLMYAIKAKKNYKKLEIELSGWVETVKMFTNDIGFVCLAVVRH